ncbi:hypothetical protein EZS27_000758 [termite gut metagenome]|uniref:HTH cro/C1-type domain-containing protein n=1 Tax=termite gut metagenome TaxID=433724 RepID=A0A5J4T2S8_9ZZZZ
MKSTEKIFCMSRKYPQKAVAIFDITYYFVHTYLRWGDRTIDQMQQAARSGLSVFTISSFENGSSTGITLASFIKLLRAIDNLEEIDKLLPELPESPRALFKKQSKK